MKFQVLSMLFIQNVLILKNIFVTNFEAQPPAEKKAKTEGADAAGADDPNSNLFLDESFVHFFPSKSKILINLNMSFIHFVVLSTIFSISFCFRQIPNEVKNFLGTLPGVDVNDAKIQDALRFDNKSYFFKLKYARNHMFSKSKSIKFQ